ncbi:MAG: DUF1223 domain-containing protein [Sulfitobacter sp.]
MNRILPLMTASLIGLSAPLAAEQIPVVLELYTSQGCSSCPPADAIMRDISNRDDVIAIAMHVDYWDYIGWKDEFGNPDFAKRQRAYANTAGRRTIYTPEMVVNGVTDIVGARPMKVAEAIEEHKSKAPRMTLDAERAGDTLRIQGSVPSGKSTAMDVHVLRMYEKKETKITRGENRGKTLEYHNIAHDWQTVVTGWNGTGPLDLTVQGVTGDDPVVVLVQEANAGPIVSAARLN